MVVADDRTYVLYTENPASISLLINGESVTRDMNCGPQEGRVRAVFTPDGSGPADATGLRGMLRLFEFLEP